MLLLGDLGNEVENLVGIAPFVVVPRHDLDESLIELDSGPGVEDRRAGLVTEVRRDDLFVGVSRTPFMLPSAVSFILAQISS